MVEMYLMKVEWRIRGRFVGHLFDEQMVKK